MLKRAALVIALVALTFGFARQAHATGGSFTGYVCESAWVSNPSAFASYLNNMGSYGVVYAYVYTQPQCKGTQVGMAYFCTTGATNASWCSLSQLMTESQANALNIALQHAGALSQKVTFYTLGAANAGGFVEFTQP